MLCAHTQTAKRSVVARLVSLETETPVLVGILFKYLHLTYHFLLIVFKIKNSVMNPDVLC
jgi:hypothetical protein